MTDEQINEIASSYMEMNADIYVSFLPSNLDKFARAVEQASRRAALEEAATTVGALHEKISAQEIIGFDAWSAGHLALDNAACHIRALANGDT